MVKLRWFVDHYILKRPVRLRHFVKYGSEIDRYLHEGGMAW